MKKITFFAVLLALLSSCAQSNKTYVIIETPYGNMKAELFDDTPIHRDNFVKLVQEGFYDELLFHRVIPNFMIQGGDPDSREAQPGQMLGMGGPGYTLEAEIGKPHLKGALAAARTGGAANPEKRSSGSQFYIVEGGPVPEAMLNQVEQMRGVQYTPEQRKAYLENGGYPPLDGDYTVFGQIVEGLEVINKISTAPRAPSDRPLEDIRMKVRLK
jgi:cyclophilin family peptidyl-prolyl cis-trans isomerase